MILLAVETSGAGCSVALQLPDDSVVVQSLQTSGRRHAQTLVADAHQLMQRCQVKADQLDVIAVSIGPGSFTGLRVGLVFAKTLAWVTQARLVAVDTLQVIAEQTPEEYPVVTSLVEAQRGEVFAADYRWDPGTKGREQIHPIRIVSPDFLDPTIPLSGPVLAKHEERLSRTHLLVSEGVRHPLASTVALLGRRLAEAGQFCDPASLEPVYVRRSYAEEKQP